MSAHVVEEPAGLVDRVLGFGPRLRVTLPEATWLRLTLETPLSSATARKDTPIVALVSDAVRIEGVVAIPSGARLGGKVLRAASADETGGRGELVLVFDSLSLGHQRVDVRTTPLAVRAPRPPKQKERPRKKDNALLDGLSRVGAAVGNLIERIKADTDASVQGGSADARAEAHGLGRDVVLPGQASLTVALAEPVTLVRPKP